MRFRAWSWKLLLSYGSATFLMQSPLFFHSSHYILRDLTVKDCGWRLPLRLSSRSLTLAMDTMREAALYSVSKWSLMQDTAWSTFATLPLAKAKARRVISASGLTQQLHGREKGKNTRLVWCPSKNKMTLSAVYGAHYFLRERIKSVASVRLRRKSIFLIASSSAALIKHLKEHMHNS